MKAAKFILCLWLGSLAATATAQYALDWYKVSGGGGSSSGGRFSLSATIGQHDAAPAMTGGRFCLGGGFWGLTAVVQSPGAPTLRISRAGTALTVSWQNVSGWSLQQKSALAAPNWAASSYPLTTANGTNSITITAPAGNLFFRLSQP